MIKTTITEAPIDKKTSQNGETSQDIYNPRIIETLKELTTVIEDPKLQIDRILWRKITPSDYFNTEKILPPGPKGQIHIDLPNADPVIEFLRDEDHQYVDRTEKHSRTLDNVRVMGNPTQSASLEINHRGRGRWGIARQNVHGKSGSRRHPAWDSDWGWPRDENNPPKNIQEASKLISSVKGICVYIARTLDGQFFAGMTTGDDMPEEMPTILAPLFQPQTKNIGCINLSDIPNLSPLANAILLSFQRKKNVLLYGPPGSGKTRAVAEIFQYLNLQDTEGIKLRPDDATRPFVSAKSVDVIERPVNVKWTTFHQEYGYEDFIIGLRPTGNGLQLEPVAGRLIDLARSVREGKFKSGVIVIDEINRGNVPKILGEFITYMDDDYRCGGDNPIPVSLPKLLGESGDNTKTEELVLEDGSKDQIPKPWYFPDNIFIIATMNSVDRSVAPLDSALGRRFIRIDARCDIHLLAQELGVDYDSVIGEIKTSTAEYNVGPVEQDLVDVEQDQDTDNDLEIEESGEVSTVEGGKDTPSWSPEQTAVALLYYLNKEITDRLGQDYELGHAYFFKATSWESLASVWDYDLWPQLRDRFGSRPKILGDILRIGIAGAPKNYPFFKVDPRSSQFEAISMQSLSFEDMVKAFHFLSLGV